MAAYSALVGLMVAVSACLLWSKFPQCLRVVEKGSPLRSVQRRLDMRVLSRVRSVHVKLEDPVPLCLGNLMWSAGRSVHVRLEVVVKFSFLKLIETCVLSA